MNLLLALRIVIVLFIASEAALLLRRRSGGSAVDQGSLRLLWVVIGAAVGAAFYATRFDAGRMGGSRGTLLLVSRGMMLAGMLFRWVAIRTLGRFFTVDVAIHEGHAVVDSGPYRLVRHPSYSGLLLTFAGLGLSFQDWISLAVLLLPVLAVLLTRIAREERVLREALGQSYLDYCARTKRLLPGLL